MPTPHPSGSLAFKTPGGGLRLLASPHPFLGPPVPVKTSKRPNTRRGPRPLPPQLSKSKTSKKTGMRRGSTAPCLAPLFLFEPYVFEWGDQRLLASPPLRSGLLVRIEARVTGSLPTLAFTLPGPRASWPCPNRGPRTVAPAPRPPSYPPSHPSRLQRHLGMDTGGGVRGRLPACSLPA